MFKISLHSAVVYVVLLLNTTEVNSRHALMVLGYKCHADMNLSSFRPIYCHRNYLRTYELPDWGML
jgi:hypothetical protein